MISGNEIDMRFRRSETLAPDVWEEIELVRRVLRGRGLAGVSDMYVDGFGYVSKVVGLKGAFIVSGAGTCTARELDGRLYSKVNHIDLDMMRVDAEGRIEPPWESVLMGAIHNARHDVRAIICTRNEVVFEKVPHVGGKESTLAEVISSLRKMDKVTLDGGFVGLRSIPDMVFAFGLMLDSVAVRLLDKAEVKRN